MERIARLDDPLYTINQFPVGALYLPLDPSVLLIAVAGYIEGQLLYFL